MGDRFLPSGRSGGFLDLHNATAAPLSAVPEVAVQAFRRALLDCVAEGARVKALFGLREGGDDAGAASKLIAVVARGQEGVLGILSTRVETVWPSLTPECPQLHLFEREMAENGEIEVTGHPWLKPVRRTLQRAEDFFRVDGAEIHEVAVGPVHAGVIEPGHFRFQCHGEEVLHLEIALGYQHRGIERALTRGPHPRSIHQMETAAGDTSIGHALAYCQALEALSSTPIPARAEAIRGIALELERLANHTGDLGALAGDIGFLPTLSFCGRIRGDFLNLTAQICGSRFGRTLVRPGGVVHDLDEELARRIGERLASAGRDVDGAVELLLSTQSVAARFEDTGAITEELCRGLGLVGVAARACGLERDVRHEFPTGIYQFIQIPVSTWDTGDVFARAQVRVQEIQRSLSFIAEQLRGLPSGTARAPLRALRPEGIAVALVEGWRGEICHVAVTGADSRLVLYKIIDPSFHNWTGLAQSLRGEAISDFPLCNKSFNLSYCGHDL